MRRLTRALLLFVILLMILDIAMPGVADQTKNPLAIDLVIAIDDRYENYMGQKMDEYGLRFEAASALISMCDSNFSRAAYFMFNENLYVSSGGNESKSSKVNAEDIALFDITLPLNKPQRLNIMDTLTGDRIKKYEERVNRSHRSDISMALSAAVDVEIRNKDNGNRKIIVLISSGDNTLSAAAQEKAREARQLAIDNGIEIYSVAWKNSSSARMLQELATSPEKYQFAANVEDLVDVFRNFFADMIGSTPREIKSTKLDDTSSQIQLTIPNESVAEVNLIIPVKQVTDLVLTAPDGTEIKKSDNTVLVNQSRNFSTYKLINPQPNDYFLKYKSDNDKDIVVQYVFSYSVQVQTEVNAARISKHEPVTVKAYYMDNGIATSDSKLYNIPATLTLYKEDKVVLNQQMEVNGNSYVLTMNDLMPYGPGKYVAKMHFEGDGMLRDGEIEFELLNNAPQLVDAGRKGETFNETINKPQSKESYNVQNFTKSWDLNTFVKDINGDTLHAELVSTTADVDVLINGMNMSITPRKNTATEGEVRVVVKDTEGAESDELVFPVSVINYEDRYNGYSARFDPIKDLKKNTSRDIVLRLYDENGNKVEDDNQVPETVEAVITNAEGTQNISLQLIDGAWYGQLVTGGITDGYTFAASVPIGQKVIAAETYTLSSTNDAPKLKAGVSDYITWKNEINEPGVPESYEPMTKTWSLGDMVEDSNGDDVTFKVDEEASVKDVVWVLNPDSKEITLTTKRNQEADGDIVVRFQDNEIQADQKIVFHVTVISKELKYTAYTAKIETQGHGKNKEIPVTLTVSDEKGILVKDDPKLPEKIDASYTLNGVQKNLELVLGNDGKWTGSIKTSDKEETFLIKAAVPVSDNIKIEAPDYTLNTENKAPTVRKELNKAGLVPETINIEPFLLWNDETGPIIIEDLNEYFNDVDNEKLTFSIKDSNLGDSATAVISGSKLTITGLKETSEPVSFTVSAIDNEKAEALTKPVEFSVKSLQKQGTIILILVAVGLIVLFILYQIMKPGFHGQSFDVFAKKGSGADLAQGKSIVLKGKKAAKLGNYTTSSAKATCGTDIPTATLNKISLKPAYGNRVKVKPNGAAGVVLKIGTAVLDMKKGGSLAPHAVLSVENGDTALKFQLQTAGSGVAKTPATPTAPSGSANNSSAPVIPQKKRAGRT